ncbi:MAG TPA: hypothetical protein VGK19_19965 [Capsulimonadaceae bacterium]|jgi:predicted nucleic acid-binding protein
MVPQRVIILDAYPLGNAALPLSRDEASNLGAQACRHWIEHCESMGAAVLVPAITYYEVLREIELRGAGTQLQRLQSFCFNANRFIPLSTHDLTVAARLWAAVRRDGQPTADRHALDGDAILAAQVRNLPVDQSHCVIATSNVKHLIRFGVKAAEWHEIEP